MEMKGTIFILYVMLFITGCEELTDRAPRAADPNLLVVEGLLTNERINHLIRLSLPYAEQNQPPLAASGATVRLQGGSDVVTLTEFPEGSGNYYTPKFRAVTGMKYTLLILYRGKQYTAADESVPVEPLAPLRYRKTDKGYTLVYNSTGQDPNYINYDLAWKHTDRCDPEKGCEARVTFYDLKTIDVNEIFKPEAETLHFPLQTIVVRKKYSVSPAYRSFLRSVMSETAWRGGIFDVQRANPPTNLAGGAIGFFAVSTVVSDTTVIVR